MIARSIVGFIIKKHQALLRLLVLPFLVATAAAQSITFSGVPSNATVQCLSDVPGGLLSVAGAIPFGVSSNEISGLSVGDVITVQQVSPGNVGKLDLCGLNMSSSPNFINYVVNGVPCTVSVGDYVTTGVGNTGLNAAFSERLAVNPVVFMPIVDSFPVGRDPVGITGFIVAEILGASGGSGWNGQLQILSALPILPIVTAAGPCGPANVVFQETRTNPSNACNDVITRIWTASDSCANTASATQTIVIANTTPPAIGSCPPNITVNTSAGLCSATNVNLGTMTAAASCYGSVCITNDAPSVFPTGTNAVLWFATDSCGNVAICAQQIIVVDNQPPVISCPGNILALATDTNGAVVTFAPTATDNCDGSVVVNAAPASGATFTIGTTPVLCTAIDSSGNETNCTFNVTVIDPATFRIISCAAQNPDVLLTWMMPQGFTGIVQSTMGDIDGNFSNSFTDLGAPVFVPGRDVIVTNYLDAGAITNFPSRYYRIRLLP